MENKLLRLPQTLELSGLKRATLYRFVKEGHFPKPVKMSDFGRCVAWRSQDVEEWIKSRQTA